MYGFSKLANELSYEARKELPKRVFVYPKGYDGNSEGKFPIENISHARNALARAHFAPDPERVRSAVYSKYPELAGLARHKEALVAGLVSGALKAVPTALKAGLPLAASAVPGALVGGAQKLNKSVSGGSEYEGKPYDSASGYQK